MADLEKELKKFSNKLQKAKQKGAIAGFALIGALAVSARSRPRATQDIDFLVSAEDEFFSKHFPATIKSMGYSYKIFTGGMNDPINGLIRIYNHSGEELVDIIPVYWKWQDEMVKDAPQVKISKDLSIPIALAEDLVVLKLKAHGPQDLLDVKELLRAMSFGRGFDRGRLDEFARRAGVGRDLKKVLSALDLK